MAPKAGAAIMDVHAHETDLRAAFGLEPELSDEVLAWAADPTPYLDTFFLFDPTDHPVGLEQRL